MKPGEIVIFRKRKEPCCGIFLSSDGATLTVFSEEGRKMSIPEDKVALATGIEARGSGDREWKTEMRRLRRELEESKKDFDLRTVWECFADSVKTASFEDILSVCRAGAETTPEQSLKLFWAVDKDAVYFKRDRGGYTPLSAKCVEKTLLRLKKRAEQQKQEDLSVEWIKSVLAGSPAAPDGFDRDQCVKTVMAYIENTGEIPAFRKAHAILSQAGVHDPEAATEFLVKTGDLPEGSDPVMIRVGIGRGFSPEALAEASRFLSGVGGADFLEDMTALETFSIDDETTEDIDDAISVEMSEDKVRVGVHIANVALCVSPGSGLDREALAAGETMYLPEHRADIFPDNLITGRLSLLEGTPRAALSVLASFDPQTFEIKDFRFCASKIAVRNNMSYGEADQMFESSRQWKKLAEICRSLKQKRIERGAFTVHIPELKIKTGSGGNVDIATADAQGVSHSVISELMIMTNHLSALFLRDRKIPAIFRSQPEPVSEEARDLDTQDPLFPVRVVKFLKPSRTGVRPDWHRSLGVDCYVQATSPIRRYRDLVVQRQIMSGICPTERVEEDDILRIIADTEQNIHSRRVAQRSRKRFWLCEHFRRLGADSFLDGIVSRVADRRVFVYLPRYCSEFPLHGAANLREGEEVKVAVKKVDPIRRRLKLHAV